jgi:hypothetical protein
MWRPATSGSCYNDPGVDIAFVSTDAIAAAAAPGATLITSSS